MEHIRDRGRPALPVERLDESPCQKEAMEGPDGSFTPSLLLAIGLIVLGVVIITQLKDPQLSMRRPDHLPE